MSSPRLHFISPDEYFALHSAFTTPAALSFGPFCPPYVTYLWAVITVIVKLGIRVILEYYLFVRARVKVGARVREMLPTYELVIVRFSNRVMSANYLFVRARVREMVLRYSPMYSSNSWPTAHRHRIFRDATAVLLDRADGSGGSGTIDDDGVDDDDCN